MTTAGHRVIGYLKSNDHHENINVRMYQIQKSYSAKELFVIKVILIH